LLLANVAPDAPADGSQILAESTKTSRSAKDVYVNFPFTRSDGEIYGQW